MRRLEVLGPALVVLLLGGCVDTALGLEATIQAARVQVAGDAVTVSVDVDYRVGPYAEGDRMFQPQTIELYVDGALVSSVTPGAPPGFVSRVSPGESLSTTLGGTEAMVSSASALCGGGEVVVLFRWLDSAGSAAATPEIGMTEASTTDVVCSG